MKRFLYIFLYTFLSIILFISLNSCGGSGGATFGGDSSVIESDDRVSDTLKLTYGGTIDNKKLVVKFNEPVLENDAENVNNYLLSGSALNNAPPKYATNLTHPLTATLLPDNKTVILTVSGTINSNSNLTIKVQNVRNSSYLKISNESLFSEKIISTLGLSEDDQAPDIIFANFSSNNQIIIKFSELVDPDTALDITNYNIEINNNIIITANSSLKYETFLENNKIKTKITITLTNTQNVIDGDIITIHANNICDVSMNQNTTNNINLSNTIDITPPRVIANDCIFLNPTSIKITFNEEMNEESVENPINYQFDYGLEVISANISSDKKSVILTTTIMLQGQEYNGRVINVTDISDNFIDPDYNTFTIVYALNEPTNVNATYIVEEGKTKITWNDDPEAIYYKIYRNTAKITAANIDSLNFLDTVEQGIGFFLYEIPQNTEGYFYYAVISHHADGSEDRDFSGSNSMNNPIYEDNIIPEQATGIQVTYNFISNETTITWNDATIDNNELYKILRYNSPITNTNYQSANIIVSNIIRGTGSYVYEVPENTAGTFYYAVVSYDNAGNINTNFSNNNMASVYEDNVNELPALAYFKVLPYQSSTLEIYFKSPNSTLVTYIKILRKSGSYPQNPNDGDIIYYSSCIPDTQYNIYDDGLTEGNTYYYAGFTIDDNNRYSSITDIQKVSEVKISSVIPCTFVGSITIDGNNAPIGTKIRAFDPDGVFCGYFEVSTEGQYTITVTGDDSDPDDIGATGNDQIIFYVNGVIASSLGDDVWLSGNTKQNNLQAISP